MVNMGYFIGAEEEMTPGDQLDWMWLPELAKRRDRRLQFPYLPKQLRRVRGDGIEDGVRVRGSDGKDLHCPDLPHDVLGHVIQYCSPANLALLLSVNVDFLDVVGEELYRNISVKALNAHLPLVGLGSIYPSHFRVRLFAYTKILKLDSHALHVAKHRVHTPDTARVHRCAVAPPLFGNVIPMPNLETLVLGGVNTSRGWSVCPQRSGCPILIPLRPRHLVLVGCPTPSIPAVHGLNPSMLSELVKITLVVHPNERSIDMDEKAIPWLHDLLTHRQKLRDLVIVFRPYRNSKTWEPAPTGQERHRLFGPLNEETEAKMVARGIAVRFIIDKLAVDLVVASGSSPLNVLLVEAGSCRAQLLSLKARSSTTDITDRFKESLQQSVQKILVEGIRKELAVPTARPSDLERETSNADEIMSRVHFKTIEEYAQTRTATDIFGQEELSEWISWPRPFQDQL